MPFSPSETCGGGRHLFRSRASSRRPGSDVDPDSPPRQRTASATRALAELVLVGSSGAVLGKLPPVRAGSPWWAEVGSVVHAVREQHGLEVVILRLLSAERAGPPGGRVTYLAQVAGTPACQPCDIVLDAQPSRPSYAEIGGPERDLSWARRVLAGHGIEASGPAVQVKTWNLSSLWRIPVGHEHAWLKAVPGFFAHEAKLIAALAPLAPVPRLLGHDGGRMLLAEIAGKDLFEATLAQRLRMIELLVELQRACSGRLPELSALGVHDFRAAWLAAGIERAIERVSGALPQPVRRRLARFAAALERRFAALAQCGLPDTLVHGDFHPGNLRGEGLDFTLLDFGDAGVGHPLLDQSAFLERAPQNFRAPLRTHWQRLWQEAIPGSEPARAWQLIEPIAAARQALIYLEFLDHIEPAEHPYHARDPALWLERTAEILEHDGTG